MEGNCELLSFGRSQAGTQQMFCVKQLKELIPQKNTTLDNLKSFTRILHMNQLRNYHVPIVCRYL